MPKAKTSKRKPASGRKSTRKKPPARLNAESKPPAKKANQFDQFIDWIANGREFYLACHESGADPETVVDRLKWDELFVRQVNHAKRLAYERVMASLYDSAQRGNVAAIKLWQDLRAAAYESGFGSPIPSVDMASTEAPQEEVGRPS